MMIGGDYSSPVVVNGFSCRNCADVDNAKKNIDPANPTGGPFGVNSDKKDTMTSKDRPYDSRLSDPEKLAQAHQEIIGQQTSDVERAYRPQQVNPGTYLSLTI